MNMKTNETTNTTIIPEGVTAIGNNTFTGCTSLPEVAMPAMPEGVTDIGYYAFEGCTSLPEVAMPEGVTAIEDEDED